MQAIFYGLRAAPAINLDCIGGSCGANPVEDAKANIPSLQEIAGFNQGFSSGSSPTNEYSGSLESLPAVNQVESQQQLPQDTLQTPATTMTPGATVANGIGSENGAITDSTSGYPVTPESIQYLNGFIRTQIGRRVSIDFLVGSNTIVTKSGYLLGVAANYILLNELDTNDLTTCDFFNIKFIRFYY
ncbi:MAG: hypothetical protein LUF33_03395 [Clostridiales bacterium]|nr:hypothetical protein [Clostridiales bacterium]